MTWKWFTEEEEPPKKKRGRPKGSTNKPKISTTDKIIPFSSLQEGQVAKFLLDGTEHVVYRTYKDTVSLTEPGVNWMDEDDRLNAWPKEWEVELYPPGTVLRVEILK